MASKYVQGKYTLKNPKKYVGDSTNIVFRSSWEYAFFTWCDTTTSILKWCSEEIVIPYVSTIDGKPHRYFVDAMIEYKTPKGGIKRALVEIKPWKQTQTPKTPKRKTKAFINECLTYQTNQDKWAQTIAFCKTRDIDFIILTEKGPLVLWSGSGESVEDGLSFESFSVVPTVA